MTIFLSVEYEEFEPSTYEGCSVRVYETEDKFTIDTGNFDNDISIARIISGVVSYLTGDIVMCLSSVDHFYQDRE